MDSLLEKFTDLKLTKEEAKEPVKPKKTCFINDSKLVEFIGQNEKLVSSISKFAPPNKGRLLNDKETQRLNNIAPNSLISESDSYIVGSSCELVAQLLVANSYENGVALVKRRLSTLNFERAVIDLVLDKHNIKRLLVINWDREANRTVQSSYYDDPRILNISIHTRQKNEETSFDRIGKDAGLGFNVNIEINDDCYENSDFMSILHNLLLPISYEFNPELILISTSFDAIETSVNSQTRLTPSIYGHYVHFLSCIANGKICLFIDVEKTTDSLIESSLLALRSLSTYPCRRLDSLVVPKPSTVENILNLTAVLRPYWCCLQLLNEDDETINLDDFIKMQKIENLNHINVVKQESDPLAKQENQKIEDDLIAGLDELSLSTERRTCICTDEAMMQHYNLTEPVHPERPDRIKAIMDRLKELGLLSRCALVASRRATDVELEYCHEPDYIESLRALKAKSNDELIEMSYNKHSVYYNSSTFDSACLAAGCLLNVVDQVCSKKHLNGVAVVRPPGHHAFCDACSGFCFFNSVGIATRYAQKKYPTTIKKVLILDFDVHHGNGTQDIFEEDDSVLFISLHRYDDGLFYPAHSNSNYDCVGEANGKGFTVNVPWNQSQAGDAEYTAAFLRIVMPIAYQFNPDLVMVSAGFDAAEGDPLGGFKVTPVGYAQMTKMLCSLANGNVIMALEGGYNLNSISKSMSSCVSMLLGDQCPAQVSTIPKPQ